MVYNRPQNPATPTFSAHLKSVYNFFEPTKVSFFHQNANTSPENFPNFLFSSPVTPSPVSRFPLSSREANERGNLDKQGRKPSEQGQNPAIVQVRE